MNTLKQQIDMILNNKVLPYYSSYSMYFDYYFDASIFEKEWNIKMINNKYYYFNDMYSPDYPYRIKSTHEEFLKILALIDNNKSMALLNIRNYIEWPIVDMIIQEILKGNKIHLEKVI
jgi:hypothetical protein